MVFCLNVKLRHAKKGLSAYVMSDGHDQTAHASVSIPGSLDTVESSCEQSTPG